MNNQIRSRLPGILSRVSLGGFLLALVLVLVLLAVPAPVTYAAGTTITVTSTSGGTGGPACKLRDAITAANNGMTTGGCTVPGGSTGPYSIVLAQGAVYTLNEVDNDSYGPNGLPAIRTGIIIQGNGATIKRANTEQRFRIFQVGQTLEKGPSAPDEGVPGRLTLNKVTVSSGWTLDDDYYNDGGGIYVTRYGTLTVNDSKITGNKTGNWLGTPAAPVDGVQGGYGGGGDGGGIYNQGVMQLTNTTVSGNVTGNGIYSGGYGGGIYNEGPLVLTNCTITANRTGSSDNEGGRGGGIYNASIKTGAPASTNAAECREVCLTGTVVSNNITGNGGEVGGFGGGIATEYGDMALIKSTVSGNKTGDGTAKEGYGGGGYGGGIANRGHCYYDEAYGGLNCYGRLFLQDSSVSGNATGNTGGNSKGRPGSMGGGLANLGGSLNMLNSTVSVNETGSGDAFLNGSGGGLANIGYSYIANSTFAGNKTAIGGWGGAIYSEPYSYNDSPVSRLIDRVSQDSHGAKKPAALLSGSGASDARMPQQIGEYDGYVYFSTLAGNTASQGGGIYVWAGAVGLETTIVANNPIGGDCATGEAKLGDEGYNLDSDGSCNLDNVNHSKPSTNPRFAGSLANNGGPTKTIALSAISPARNAIPGELCGEIETDQRGILRPQPADGKCDIGAYEFKPAPVAKGDGTVKQIATVLSNGSVILYTATIRNAGTGIAQSLVLQDPLDPVTRLMWATTTQGTCTGTATVKCTIGSMAPGQVVTVKILVQVLRSVPSVTNTVSLSGTGDTNLTNNKSTVTVQLGGQ